MSHLPWQKFALWNAIAAFFWAVAFSNIGYLFGDLIQRIPHGEDKLEAGIHQAMLTVVGLFLLIVGVRVFSSYLHKRQLAQSTDKTE